jgi:proline dehydrogenase
MLLRRLLLFLAGQTWVRRLLEAMPLSRRMVRRFVAGERLEDALAVCRRLAGEGMLATLDYLGENVSTDAAAGASAAAYHEAIARLGDEQIPDTVSLKLTQFGLDLSYEGCLERVAGLAEAARARGTRIEIDMESSEYTDRTLAVVEAVHERTANVRAVIQAYLFRSEADVERLNRAKIPVRLCKGAYLEPPEVAFASKAEVDDNYRRLLRRLLAEGTEPAIATHDESIIRDAERWIAERKLAPDRYEYQMLYGVRRDLQRRLVQGGARVRLYVPYGSEWYPYFMRRLAERPANILFVLRNLIRNF